MKKWLLLSVLFIVSCETYFPEGDLIEEKLAGEIIIPDSPTVWVPFSGDFTDHSANNFTTNVFNVQLTSDQYDSSNQAAEFDTTGVINEGTGDDFISIPHRNEFNEESITVSAWVYPESRDYNVDNTNYTIASRWDGGEGSHALWRFKLDKDGYLVFVIGDGDRGIDQILRSNTAIQFDMWSNVTFTFNKGDYKFYIDGVSAAIGSTEEEIHQFGSDLVIGETYMSNGYWYYFDGKMDNFGFWTRALSEDEVSDLSQI